MDNRTGHGPDEIDGESALDDPGVVAERVVLHAERPRIVKTIVEGRRAVITRRAVTVRKTIQVDVIHEELQIDYQAGSGVEMSDGEAAVSIVVPLHAEEIEIVKHVRVVEEVLLSKRRTVETVPMSVGLEREELVIADSIPSAP